MKFGSKFSLLFFIMFTFFSNPVFSVEGLVTAETIQKRIDVVSEMKDSDEKLKTQLLDLYSKTLSNLDSIDTNNQQSVAFEATRKQAPKEIKQLEEKLAKQEQQKQTPPSEKSSAQVLASLEKRLLPELEQAYNSESANLAAVIAKNADIKQSLAQENNSAQDIRKRIIDANRKLEQYRESRNLPPIPGGNTDLNKAEKWLLDSRIELLRSELKMLDLRLLSQPVRLKILKLNAELSKHSIKKVELTALQLKHQLDLKRSSEVQKTEEIAQTEQIEAQGKHPLIVAFANDNALLSSVITQRNQELIKLESSDDAVFKESQRIKDAKTNTLKKLDIAGLNQILGKVLWEQKKALPDSKRYQNNVTKREHINAQVGLENIHYQEELSNIKDRKDYIADLLRDISPETVTLIQTDLIQLIDTRKILLNKIITVNEKFLTAMTDLDFAEKKLIDIATSYSQFIDENLFWLRSSPFLTLNNFNGAPEQLQFLLHPARWLELASDFFNMIRSSYQVILGLLLFAFLLLKRAKIKGLLTQSGKKTKKVSTDSLLHTWKALFYTFLLVIPVPMLLLITGWQLTNMYEASFFSHAVASGMLIIAFPLFSLIAFREMCLPSGLFNMHFKWSIALTNGLKNEMGRLMLTFIPIIFTAKLLLSIEGAGLNSGMGRLLILLTLTTFALFFYRLLNSKTGLLRSAKEPLTFIARYRAVLLFFTLMIVAFLMGLAIIGYVYTAARITELLIYSVWFIFALVFLQHMSLRWLLLTRHRYALKIEYEKRQEAQALKQRQRDQDGLQAEDDGAIEIEEPKIDIKSLSEESQKLLNLGLFLLAVSGFVFIWAEILPALNIFEKVTLWHHEGVVDGAIQLVPVSLADLGLAVLILVITIVGAKRFPSIIGIVLLQNNHFSSGERYTITTLTNYIIIGVGVFTVFNILGADWNRFQWLFAALSVGIGFGLQEIVANFISGLIILFERPIRVGDHISVGENQGIVSRIQIRATTILTYDRKELLVPNKEFITGQLVNLSLSDPIARLVIPVGVAYGSDVAKAKQLMLETATQSEHMLDEPTPSVIFKDFGDNSLNLELRCFVANVENRMFITSEINEVINEKFNAAGICIAFPQRDVHLDINQPIDIRVQGKTES